jgi:drug/metabolite transporter (DMT)-like permease
MLVLATSYWGVSFPLIKSITALNRILLPGAGTWFLCATAVAPRFLLAALLMLVVGRGKGGRVTHAEVTQGMVLAIFGAGGSLFQTDGLQFTDASTSSFLTQLTAILVPGWLAVRNRRSPGLGIWLACILVLAGVAVLGHLDLHSLRLGRGEWETLLCAVFFVGQILWVDKREYAGNRAAVVTLVMFIGQAAIFTLLAAFTAPGPGALLVPWASAPWVGLTLVLAVVCTAGAFSIMNKWQPKISPTQAALIYCVEPLFASIFVLFLPALFSVWAGINYSNEVATWSLVLGGGLITVANVMVQIKSVRYEPAKRENQT